MLNVVNSDYYMDENKSPLGTPSDQVINAEQIWKYAWTYIKTVVDTVREPFLVLDADLRVLSANQTFYNTFQVAEEATVHKKLYDLGNGQWNIPKLKSLLDEILPKNTFFKDFEVDHDFPTIGRKIIILNARRIYAIGEINPIIMLAMEDVTKQKNLEGQLKEYAEKLSQQASVRTVELEKRVLELERLNKNLMEQK